MNFHKLFSNFFHFPLILDLTGAQDKGKTLTTTLFDYLPLNKREQRIV